MVKEQQAARVFTFFLRANVCVQHACKKGKKKRSALREHVVTVLLC